MKTFLLLLPFYLVVMCVNAAPVSAQFKAMPVRELVDVVYGDILHKPYVIDAGMLGDATVSLSLGQVEPVVLECELNAALLHLNVVAETVMGVVRFHKL